MELPERVTRDGSSGQTMTISGALSACRRYFWSAALFSAVINFLYLTPTIFMLQVYDRVVPTGGLMTLAFIGSITLACYITLAVLDGLRSRLLTKASSRLDRELAPPILAAVMTDAKLSRVERVEALRDLDRLRALISGSAIVAAFDAPWVPIYFLAALAIHPLLGVFTLISGAVLVALAWRAERVIETAMSRASSFAAIANARQSQLTAFSAEARALGMAAGLCAVTLAERSHTTELHTSANMSSANYASLTKFVRLSAQSGALALAAWLTVDGVVSAGAIFAASLLLGRALAPIELLTMSWKHIVRGQKAYRDLKRVLTVQDEPVHLVLPPPTGRIEIENLLVMSPSGHPMLTDFSLEIASGEIIGIAGPSGSGKSTLLKCLSGALQSNEGSVRLDDAALCDWNREQLACAIGYVSQESVMFAGTIKDNIARFRYPVSGSIADIDRQVVEAAQQMRAHETILRLPHGYETVMGPGQPGLSGGQAQRVAIARALFGDPKLLILDEPSANLDAEAKAALVDMLAEQRRRGVTTIFSTHDQDLLLVADKIAVLSEGRLVRYSSVPKLAGVLAQRKRA